MAGDTVSAITFSVASCTPVAPCASRATTLKRWLAAAVGVPLTAPFGCSDRPAGSCPAITLNVYGAAPPLATNVALNG